MKKVKFNKYSLLLLLVIGIFAVYVISNLDLKQTGQIISETQTITTKNTSYVYAHGLAASYDSEGKEKYYINDHLGGTSKVIDKSGNVVASDEYLAFGEEKAAVGDEKFTYTGKELDDTGFYYYGARYYDADTGRFTQPDPLIGGIENPQSLNRYAYTLNNPLKYTDPSGMEGECAVCDRAKEEAKKKGDWLNYEKFGGAGAEEAGLQADDLADIVTFGGTAVGKAGAKLAFAAFVGKVAKEAVEEGAEKAVKEGVEIAVKESVNLEVEAAAKRYEEIANLVSDNPASTKLLSGVVESSSDYVSHVANMEATIVSLTPFSTPSKIQEVANRLDKMRKSYHNELVAKLTSFNRHLSKHYGDKVPAGGIFSGVNINDRNAVSDWAGNLVEALSK